ncbi:hypothetical protein HDU67_010035 [Dinochytrium kinnereticum]|nr:hypothetical protein HDU67_010035 [Dinochytrium kinnereticum]
MDDSSLTPHRRAPIDMLPDGLLLAIFSMLQPNILPPMLASQPPSGERLVHQPLAARTPGPGQAFVRSIYSTRKRPQLPKRTVPYEIHLGSVCRTWRRVVMGLPNNANLNIPSFLTLPRLIHLGQSAGGLDGAIELFTGDPERLGNLTGLELFFPGTSVGCLRRLATKFAGTLSSPSLESSGAGYRLDSISLNFRFKEWDWKEWDVRAESRQEDYHDSDLVTEVVDVISQLLETSRKSEVAGIEEEKIDGGVDEDPFPPSSRRDRVRIRNLRIHMAARTLVRRDGSLMYVTGRVLTLSDGTFPMDITRLAAALGGSLRSLCLRINGPRLWGGWPQKVRFRQIYSGDDAGRDSSYGLTSNPVEARSPGEGQIADVDESDAPVATADLNYAHPFTTPVDIHQDIQPLTLDESLFETHPFLYYDVGLFSSLSADAQDETDEIARRRLDESKEINHKRFAKWMSRIDGEWVDGNRHGSPDIPPCMWSFSKPGSFGPIIMKKRMESDHPHRVETCHIDPTTSPDQYHPIVPLLAGSPHLRVLRLESGHIDLSLASALCPLIHTLHISDPTRSTGSVAGFRNLAKLSLGSGTWGGTTKFAGYGTKDSTRGMLSSTFLNDVTGSSFGQAEKAIGTIIGGLSADSKERFVSLALAAVPVQPFVDIFGIFRESIAEGVERLGTIARGASHIGEAFSGINVFSALPRDVEEDAESMQENEDESEEEPDVEDQEVDEEEEEEDEEEEPIWEQTGTEFLTQTQVSIEGMAGVEIGPGRSAVREATGSVSYVDEAEETSRGDASAGTSFENLNVATILTGMAIDTRISEEPTTASPSSPSRPPRETAPSPATPTPLQDSRPTSSRTILRRQPHRSPPSNPPIFPNLKYLWARTSPPLTLQHLCFILPRCPSLVEADLSFSPPISDATNFTTAMVNFALDLQALLGGGRGRGMEEEVVEDLMEDVVLSSTAPALSESSEVGGDGRRTNLSATGSTTLRPSTLSSNDSELRRRRRNVRFAPDGTIIKRLQQPADASREFTGMRERQAHAAGKGKGGRTVRLFLNLWVRKEDLEGIRGWAQSVEEFLEDGMVVVRFKMDEPF